LPITGEPHDLVNHRTVCNIRERHGPRCHLRRRGRTAWAKELERLASGAAAAKRFPGSSRNNFTSNGQVNLASGTVKTPAIRRAGKRCLGTNVSVTLALERLMPLLCGEQHSLDRR
jgi:hypothetical protein